MCKHGLVWNRGYRLMIIFDYDQSCRNPQSIFQKNCENYAVYCLITSVSKTSLNVTVSAIQEQTNSKMQPTRLDKLVGKIASCGSLLGDVNDL